MKPHGSAVLVVLLAAGCVGPIGRPGLVANSSAAPTPASPMVACASRVVPPPATAPAPGPSTAVQAPKSSLPPPPPIVEVPPTVEPEPPTLTVEPPPAVVEAPRPPEPEPVVEAVPVVSPPPTSTPPAPNKPKGRPVASVGAEVITLPELTEATRARLAQLGPGASPNRRQVIALARSTLKAMIVRSLVVQEAVDALGGPETLDAVEARIGRTWADRELPALLRCEGVATEADLRVKLAGRLASPESLRDDFVVRSLATELISTARPGLDFDAFLDEARKRHPVTSIMTPAELMAAGRRASTDGPTTAR